MLARTELLNSAGPATLEGKVTRFYDYSQGDRQNAQWKRSAAASIPLTTTSGHCTSCCSVCIEQALHRACDVPFSLSKLRLRVRKNARTRIHITRGSTFEKTLFILLILPHPLSLLTLSIIDWQRDGSQDHHSLHGSLKNSRGMEPDFGSLIPQSVSVRICSWRICGSNAHKIAVLG